MISLRPVIELLKPKPAGFTLHWFRDVRSVGDYALVKEGQALPYPLCFVLRGPERAKAAGERLDSCTFALDVIFAIENTRKAKTGEPDDELLEYRQAVKNLLQGFDFGGELTECHFKGGQPLQYTDRDLIWVDRYEFSGLIDNYLPDPAYFEGLDCKGRF